VKKKVVYLIIHCTATPEGREVSAADIRHWHTSPKEKGGNGWKQVGYTDLIHLDGGIEQLVANNEDGYVDPWEITNGARGFNGISRHIVYAGGGTGKRPKDTRTPHQMEALWRFVGRFIKKHPWVKVAGHGQLDPKKKNCPGFDVPEWLRMHKVPEANIFKPKKK
jgi:N-acetyl-anhydromuramyl-L-alanine amidase AmpD